MGPLLFLRYIGGSKKRTTLVNWFVAEGSTKVVKRNSHVKVELFFMSRQLFKTSKGLCLDNSFTHSKFHFGKI